MNGFSKLKKSEPTEGIFAPWAFYRTDFQEIGGHDVLYAPQSKEDSISLEEYNTERKKIQQDIVLKGYLYAAAHATDVV